MKMVEQPIRSDDSSQIIVEAWVDLGCPWCYLAKHRLQKAIAQRPDADRFTVTVRSFQLDPDAPKGLEKNEDSYVRSHPGGGIDDVRRGEQQMQAIARAEGIDYTSDRMNANTFDLHRLVQYTSDQGLGFEFFSTLQDGFFTGRLNPFDPDVIAAVAEQVGLDAGRTREILASDEYTNRVHADRSEAADLGATGVPFTVFDRRMAASGAQKVTGYAQLLEQVAGPAPTGRTS